MNNWVTRGLLLSSVLSISVVAMASARAAAQIASPSALSGANSAKGESALGNLVADALRLVARADLAFIPASMLEEKELAQAANTPEAVRKVLSAPPAEPVVVVRVQGKQLQSALNRSLSLFPRRNQGFLQVSGLAVVFDPSRPEEDRVVEVRVGTAPLDPNRFYTVAMPESLARGGLGYFNLWEPKEAKAVTNPRGEKITLTEAVLARLKEGKVTANTNGRIKPKTAS
ncbi:MAG: 5'-nucleotidase C-terminal domain-containing protein [Armatimonadetes bacterium]|nr:5'-nucleotidase C-terminal domain-containing protein [Armatimonadota bacterium]